MRRRTSVIVDYSSGWFGKGKGEDLNVCEITVLVLVINEMVNSFYRFKTRLDLPFRE